MINCSTLNWSISRGPLGFAQRKYLLLFKHLNQVWIERHLLFFFSRFQKRMQHLTGS